MNPPRPRAFLLVEMLTGIAILCGVVMVLLVMQGRATEIVARETQRAYAAAWMSEILDGVRCGDVAVRPTGEITLARESGEEAVVRCETWPEDASLTKVTVTVHPRATGGGVISIQAQTLVRTARLKAAPAAVSVEKGGAR